MDERGRMVVEVWNDLHGETRQIGFAERPANITSARARANNWKIGKVKIYKYEYIFPCANLQ